MNDEAENLKKYIERLNAEHAQKLRDMEYQIHQLKFDNEAMRWAFRGLVESRVQMRETFNETTLTQSKNLSELARQVGQHCAHAMIDGSKQSFKAHAQLNELRAYVHYLENHARNKGVSFTPLAFPENESLPERIFWPCRYFGTDAAP